MMHMNVTNVCAEFGVSCVETDSSRCQNQANSVIANRTSREKSEIIILFDMNIIKLRQYGRIYVRI